MKEVYSNSNLEPTFRTWSVVSIIIELYPLRINTSYLQIFRQYSKKFLFDLVNRGILKIIQTYLHS
jgi:hypothetical protein